LETRIYFVSVVNK